MKLIVGLGNYGEIYTKTRHNAGFIVLDAVLMSILDNSYKAWQVDKKAKSKLIKHKISEVSIVFAKPQVYMNNSGFSVQSLIHSYKIKPNSVLVIHDDIEIAFGESRLKFGGGSGGHNGLRSITNTIQTPDYYRLRIGIGRSSNHNISVAEHVLSNFTNHEYDSLIQSACSLLYPSIIASFINTEH